MPYLADGPDEPQWVAKTAPILVSRSGTLLPLSAEKSGAMPLFHTSEPFGVQSQNGSFGAQQRPKSTRATALGQFERFTPSELSDRNGFVNETFAGMGVTDGSAPIAALHSRWWVRQVRSPI
jgi:hypothetical protein